MRLMLYMCRSGIALCTSQLQQAVPAHVLPRSQQHMQTPQPVGQPCCVHAGVVQAAASILGVEAYHAGAIRTLLAIAAQDAETPYGNVTEVVQLISDLRDAVDGSSDADQGIVLDGMLNIVPTDENGLAFARSVTDVRRACWLAVVDLSVGVECTFCRNFL